MYKSGFTRTWIFQVETVNHHLNVGTPVLLYLSHCSVGPPDPRGEPRRGVGGLAGRRGAEPPQRKARKEGASRGRRPGFFFWGLWGGSFFLLGGGGWGFPEIVGLLFV